MAGGAEISLPERRTVVSEAAAGWNRPHGRLVSTDGTRPAGEWPAWGQYVFVCVCCCCSSCQKISLRPHPSCVCAFLMLESSSRGLGGNIYIWLFPRISFNKLRLSQLLLKYYKYSVLPPLWWYISSIKSYLYSAQSVKQFDKIRLSGKVLLPSVLDKW